MNSISYLLDELPEPPYAIKLNVSEEESVMDSLPALKEPQTTDSDEKKDLLLVEHYGIVNGGIDRMEETVENETKFEAENFYSVYPGSGIRKNVLNYPSNHTNIDVSNKLDWTGREQNFRNKLQEIHQEENLRESTVYYITDMAAFDTTTTRETTIPESKHGVIQSTAGYSIFLDWKTSEEYDSLKYEQFNLDDWIP